MNKFVVKFKFYAIKYVNHFVCLVVSTSSITIFFLPYVLESMGLLNAETGKKIIREVNIGFAFILAAVFTWAIMNFFQGETRHWSRLRLRKEYWVVANVSQACAHDTILGIGQNYDFRFYRFPCHLLGSIKLGSKIVILPNLGDLTTDQQKRGVIPISLEQLLLRPKVKVWDVLPVRETPLEP